MNFLVVIQHKDLTIKLFDWMSYPKGEPARNVEAFDSTGQSVWVIESLGGNPGSDCYTSIESDGETLKAFNCVVGPESGKILSSHFTK